MIAFAVAAVLASADSVTAISEWASDVPRRCWRRWVLRRLDAQAVAAAFGTWLKAQVMAGLADAEAVIIALDGKTVRGTRTRRRSVRPLT